jgi:hypothetical protein
MLVAEALLIRFVGYRVQYTELFERISIAHTEGPWWIRKSWSDSYELEPFSRTSLDGSVDGSLLKHPMVLVEEVDGGGWWWVKCLVVQGQSE